MASLPTTKKRPLRIAYDIARMSAGGANGGIKTHHYAFLRHFAETRPHLFHFSLFCAEELLPELTFLGPDPQHHVHILGPRQSESSTRPVQYWPNPPPNLLERLGCDLLYCGFGESILYTPRIPQVSLLVDALHADMPEMLPHLENAHRHRLFRDAIERSALVQTNSQFCAEALRRHYDAPAEKLLPVYLPLHRRFDAIAAAPPLPQLDGPPYFFYPANHWPHKNHETLLVAYRQYLHQTGNDAWQLALTGGSSPRRTELQQISESLGLANRVHFLDHLDEGQLKTTWQRCAALLFPSLYEGFGLPLVEAMHFQKPIIAGPIGPIPEILGQSYRPCDPTKPADLARAMAELTRDGPQRQTYDNILPRFDLEREAEKLARSLLEVADRHPVQA